MLRRPLTAAVAICAVLGLGACGSDSENVSVPTAPVSTPATQPATTAAPTTQTTTAPPPTTSATTTSGTTTGDSGGTPAPSDGTGGSSAGGSGAERAKRQFEQYCKQNPNACGE